MGMADMVDVTSTPEHEDASRAGENPTGAKAEIDRRGFLSAATLTVLGIAASHPALAQGGVLAAIRDLATAPVWKPLTALSTVSVSANRLAKGYPSLKPGSAFDHHPAVALLESALAGLSGGTAVEAVQAVVSAGGTVLIKPNWVEPARWSKGKITHPSLVLAAARIAAEAVGPTGHVYIAEGTSEGKDLPRILSATTFMKALHSFGLDAATSSRARVKVIDLNVASTGSVVVHLRKYSRFASIHDKLYDASGRALGKMGDGHIGAYRIAKPMLNADLIIDFAKSKVHCSAGATLALKNFIGVVPTSHDPKGKYRLKSVPHYSSADAHAGRKLVLNRTIGRTSADLHACVMYAAPNGSLHSTRQRRLLCIIDGVVSGQYNQFAPQTKATGWVAAGYDPVAVDHVASRCMGFDPARMPSIQPATKGTLRLGTGSPSGVRLLYHGASSFGVYFGARRALKPESLAAKWGTSISLKTKSIKTPTVTFDGTHVVVKPKGTGFTVRLYSGTDYVNLARASNGTYSADIPPEVTGAVRVVVMDSHFNVWDHSVRA
jgi:uncharacterized protein (DUF362 family)